MSGKKGQSILEYTLLVTCFIAALVTMQIYLKRGFSGRLKQTADSLGGQYDPKRTESDTTLSLESTTATVSKMVPPEYSYNDEQGNKYVLFEELEGELKSRSFLIQETTIDETSSRGGSETVYEPEKDTDLWD